MKNNRIDKWIEDIEQLALELPQRHKNLFFHLKKREFFKQIQDLKNNIESFDNYEIIVNIATIVAAVGDAHTAVAIPATRLLPFEFYWFPEGIYIISTSLEYSEALNSKVTHLNGIPINDVIGRVKRIISHENDSFLKAQLPKYISAAEVLYGAEIIDELNRVELTLEKPGGEIWQVTASTYENNKFGREIIKGANTAIDRIPLYRRNKGINYWSYFIKEHNTLYFNYNCCKDMQDISVAKFCIDLIYFIDRVKVTRLIIDLRNNLGGNSTLLEPFIRELRKCKNLNREGGIFVILGRETFSSALLNAYSLKNKTKAIFIGEASAGKPNCYGEVQYFDLKNSRLKIRYSTEYYKIIKDDKQVSFFPDVNIEITFKDYLDNRDPCLDYIVKS